MDDLDRISQWCDEHGWDALGTPAFDAWLITSGIDRGTLTIHKCGVKCDHAWDGPLAESDDGCITTSTCSKCGEWAIYYDIRNAP